MGNKKKIDLDVSDEEKTDSKNLLNINTKYAERYDNWRNKEELQKLKDKYGDVNLLDDDESSSDETEDEDARELTDDVEKEFLKALSLVKSRDPKIYDKEQCKFFDQYNSAKESEDEEEDPNKKRTKKEDKKTLKDLEREMILKKLEITDEHLENTNIYEDDENHNDNLKIKSNKSYFEEQDEIKKSLKNVVDKLAEESDDEEVFLKVKTKTEDEKEKEEADFIEWLKGKKEKIKDNELEKNMKYLHDHWNNPDLSYEEKYLRDFILNKRYIFKDSDEEDDEKDTVKTTEKDAKFDQPLDYVDLSEEEKIVENQEDFERKFNFRFEEPDPEFVKSYPRTIADSMRRKDNKRKEKRKEYKERKETEKQKKKEEIKRLKNLKRKEIMDKLEKLKKITGNYDLKLDVDDLEKDFDPDEYEKKMQATFDDEYYQQPDSTLNEDPDNEEDKPVFTDDEDEDLKYINWDEWGGKEESEEIPFEENNKKKKKKKKDDDDEPLDPDFIMDADYDPSMEQPTKAKKKGKFAEAVSNKKPIFDPNEKSFEEYFEEYYKLDCEDVIGGDLPCRFKYREVVPNDFGLTIEEILSSKDTELNQWASLRKAIQYRPIQDEIQDSKTFKNKKNQIDLKKKILASYYNPPDEEEEEEENEETDAEKVAKQELNSDKKQKSKNKKSENEKNSKEENEKESNSEKNQKSKHKKSEKDRMNKSPKKKQRVQQEENKEEEKTIQVTTKDHKIDEPNNIEKKNGIKKNKNKKKKKNKNIVESLTDERLAAY
ncbi:KRI1 -like protein, partial [Brachionus plicatilis]